MRLAFHPETHTYEVDGQAKPGVTTIMRHAGLYSDYGFAEPHHKYRGSAVHAGSAILDLGGVPQLGPVPRHLQSVADDIVQGYWPAFSRFKERTKWQGRIWECPLIDPVRGYGGCFDSVGEMDGEPTLIDLKSGTMPDMVPVQLALYWLLATKGLPVSEKHPGWAWLKDLVASGHPVKRVAVRLERDGKWTMYSQTKRGESYDAPKWLVAASSILNLHAVRSDYGLLAKI